jgi:hypothetical protein
MKEILLASHLGLGDGLLINAIARRLAETCAVSVICKPHNSTTLAFQWRDSDRITLVEADDDAQARKGIAEMRKHGKEVLGLGFFAKEKFEPQSEFDRVFYRQTGVEHTERWNGFKCARQESREIEVPSGKYCFVHDDPSRNFVIPPEALPLKRLKIVRPSRDLKNRNGDPCILFDYWGWLDGAQEIHCFDSSFAIMVDHLHLPKFENKRLVLHLGLRSNEYPPARMKNWEILRHNTFKA